MKRVSCNLIALGLSWALQDRRKQGSPLSPSLPLARASPVLSAINDAGQIVGQYGFVPQDGHWITC